MATPKPQDQTAPRPEPKTQRGRDTRDEILAAARKLASERWIDDVPFTELAAAAGVARASLLHVYPHWRNVLSDLLHEELDLLDAADKAASALKRVRPSQRAYSMLVVLIDRAESTGLLYPNLRAAMFTWQGEPREEEYSEFGFNTHPTREMLGRFMRYPLTDQYFAVEELLRVPRDSSLTSKEFGEPPIGELLIHFALDLAAGIPSYLTDFDERRHALRVNIDLIAAGLSKIPQLRVKKRSVRPTS